MTGSISLWRTWRLEEKEGAEGLVLGGGGDIAVVGKVEEEGLDFGGAHFGGTTLN